MIRNLLENARRHGVPPIEVRVRTEEGCAVLDVSDHAPLIDPRERSRLFVPFHRVPGGSQSSGTGLGLALARQIARRHSGDLACTAAGGRNCFTAKLSLPQAAR